MTIVVLVVLVLVWAVVLGPSLFRRTTHRHQKDSIGSFHRQLDVLGRTGPSLMAPAHRLDITGPVDGDEGVRLLGSVSSRPAPRVVSADAYEAGGHSVRRPDPYFRGAACKRRRDVLMVLLCTLTVTGLIGIIPALHVILAATGLVAVVLMAYLGLLVRLRNQALEREVKLRYLPRNVDDDFRVAVRRVASR